MTTRESFRVTSMDNEDGTCTVMVVAPISMQKTLISMLKAVGELAPRVTEEVRAHSVANVGMPVGAKVRYWRLERGVTQAVLAKSLGVAQARLSDMEQGVKPISTAQLATVAEVLKVPLYVLLDEGEST